MKKRDFLKGNYGIIAIIAAIVVTSALTFSDLIPNDKTINYLICADAGLAVSILLSLYKNESGIQEIKTKIDFYGKAHNITSKKVTRKEHYILLDEAVKKAKSQISIMTIDAALKRNAIGTIPEREIYYSTIETVVKSRRDISVRRIYGLPDNEDERKNRIEWIRPCLKNRYCTNDKEV